MTYRTRGQSGGNTETSVTASKSTLLHTLLLKSRRPRRTFENRPEKPGTGKTSMMTSGATYPPDRRPPVTSWNDIARLFTDHLEVQRFNQLPPHHRATAWNERRKHAPWSEAMPPAWDLDALYLRHPDERGYCDRFLQLRVSEAVASIYTDLVCLPFPWVPHSWLPPQHRIEVNRNRYPGTGDLQDPKGSDICLDSVAVADYLDRGWDVGAAAYARGDSERAPRRSKAQLPYPVSPGRIL
jgi:hypothetical protein